LKHYIGNLFPHADIPNSISPDEVLAYGAAVQASFLAKYWNAHDDLPEPTTEVHTLNESIKIDVGIKDIILFLPITHLMLFLVLW